MKAEEKLAAIKEILAGLDLDYMTVAEYQIRNILEENPRTTRQSRSWMFDVPGCCECNTMAILEKRGV